LVSEMTAIPAGSIPALADLLAHGDLSVVRSAL
jgi:hypothetical protein